MYNVITHGDDEVRFESRWKKMLCKRSGEAGAAEGRRRSNNGMTGFDTKSNYLLGLFLVQLTWFCSLFSDL